MNRANPFIYKCNRDLSQDIAQQLLRNCEEINFKLMRRINGQLQGEKSQA